MKRRVLYDQNERGIAEEDEGSEGASKIYEEKDLESDLISRGVLVNRKKEQEWTKPVIQDQDDEESKMTVWPYKDQIIP